MKLLLTLLLAAFSLQLSAQVFNFPAQGPTTAQFNVLNTNAVTLTGTQTIAGAKTFPTSLFTANTISRRMLWRTNDVYIAAPTVHADNLTNNGDFSLTSSAFNVLLPPLLGSNSIVLMGYTAQRTNLNTTSAFLNVYAGTNTNWMNEATVSTFNSIGWIGNTVLMVFQNNNSFTSQYQAPAIAGAQFNGGAPLTIANTAASWNIYGSVGTVTGNTNVLLRSIWFEEIIIP